MKYELFERKTEANSVGNNAQCLEKELNNLPPWLHFLRESIQPPSTIAYCNSSIPANSRLNQLRLFKYLPLINVFI